MQFDGRKLDRMGDCYIEEIDPDLAEITSPGSPVLQLAHLSLMVMVKWIKNSLDLNWSHPRQ